jgi:hypothetical protein
VFPVKCNQQRHVVEELVACGKRWHFGLEAGSKAELLIALSLIDDPEALLICNGYKDQRYIETAILARRLGRQPVVVIEQADEVERIISASKALGAAPFIGVRAKLSSRSTGRWGSSVGDKAKFGLSIPDLLATVEALRAADLLGDLRLQRHRRAQRRPAGSRADLRGAHQTRRPDGLLRCRWRPGNRLRRQPHRDCGLNQLLAAELRQRCGGHGARMLRTPWRAGAHAGE